MHFVRISSAVGHHSFPKENTNTKDNQARQRSRLGTVPWYYFLFPKPTCFRAGTICENNGIVCKTLKERPSALGMTTRTRQVQTHPTTSRDHILPRLPATFSLLPSPKCFPSHLVVRVVTLATTRFVSCVNRLLFLFLSLNSIPFFLLFPTIFMI